MSLTEDSATAPAASPVPARRPAAPRGSSPRQKTPPPGRGSAAPAAVANSTTNDSHSVHSAAPEESGQRAASPRPAEEGPSNGSAAAAVRKPRSSSPRGALRRSTQTETPADASVPASPRSCEPLATSATQRSVAVADAEAEDLIPRDVTAVPPCETLEDYDHEYGTVWRLEVALACAWGWTFAAIVVFAAGLYRPRVYSGSDATFGAAVDLGITTVCTLGKCATFDYSGADFVVGTCRAKGSDFLWRIIFLQVLLGLSAIGALISWIGATFAALRPVMPTRITVAAFGAWVSFVFGAAGMVLAYFTFSSFIFCSGFCVAVATASPCGEGVGDSFYMLCGAIGAMLVSALIFTRLRWAVYKSQQQRCEEREAAEEERLAAAFRRKREREEARRRELEARRLEQQRKRQRRVQITEPIEVANPSETSRGAEASTAYVAPVEEEIEELPSPIKEPAAAAEAEPVNYSQRSGVLTPERTATDVGVSVRTDATAQEWTFEPGAGMYYSDSGAVWWDPVHRQYYDSAARLWSRQDPRALTAAEREDRDSLVSSRNSLLNQSRNVVSVVVSPVRRSVQSPEYSVVMAQSVRQGLDVSVLRRSSHAESSTSAVPTNRSTANPLPPTAAEATPQRPRITVKRRAASPSSAQRPSSTVERRSSSFRRFDPELGEWVEGNA